MIAAAPSASAAASLSEICAVTGDAAIIVTLIILAIIVDTKFILVSFVLDCGIFIA